MTKIILISIAVILIAILLPNIAFAILTGIDGLLYMMLRLLCNMLKLSILIGILVAIILVIVLVLKGIKTAK